MEYIYAAMLLHSAGKEIKEDAVKKVLDAAGVKADDARIKALVSALEGVDIEEAMNKAVAAPVASAPATAGSDAAPAEDKKEEKKEEKEEKKASASDSDESKEEEAAAGLGALFG